MPDIIVIPMSVYRYFILGKGLKVVVSRGREQALITLFNKKSVPSPDVLS
ncbi:MAG: hypothetical protein K2J15_01675 [Muribaculaceae bacterium]|nr:hypothetical protein [Muribaculaceae bacterium]